MSELAAKPPSRVLEEAVHSKLPQYRTHWENVCGDLTAEIEIDSSGCPTCH